MPKAIAELIPIDELFETAFASLPDWSPREPKASTWPRHIYPRLADYSDPEGGES